MYLKENQLGLNDLFKMRVPSCTAQNMQVTVYLLSFVETPRKFIIAELSIRKLGSSSVLIIHSLLTSSNDF